MDFAQYLREHLKADDWPHYADYAVVINGKIHWVGGGFIWRAHGFLDADALREMEHFACSRDRYFTP